MTNERGPKDPSKPRRGAEIISFDEQKRKKAEAATRSRLAALSREEREKRDQEFIKKACEAFREISKHVDVLLQKDPPNIPKLREELTALTEAAEVIWSDPDNVPADIKDYVHRLREVLHARFPEGIYDDED